MTMRINPNQPDAELEQAILAEEAEDRARELEAGKLEREREIGEYMTREEREEFDCWHDEVRSAWDESGMRPSDFL